MNLLHDLSRICWLPLDLRQDKNVFAFSELQHSKATAFSQCLATVLKNTLPTLFLKLHQAVVTLSSLRRDPWKEISRMIKSTGLVKTNSSTMASKGNQCFLRSLDKQFCKNNSKATQKRGNFFLIPKNALKCNTLHGGLWDSTGFLFYGNCSEIKTSAQQKMIDSWHLEMKIIKYSNKTYSVYFWSKYILRFCFLYCIHTTILISQNNLWDSKKVTTEQPDLAFTC